MRIIATILVILISTCTMQAQNLDEILKEVNKGERLDTLISFDKNNDLGYIPLSIIKGKNPGMVFTIVAGVHGYEYPPIMAVQKLQVKRCSVSVTDFVGC